MSQQGSSVLSNQNFQHKYKKALIQIKKLHTANMILKDQSQQIKANFERQMNELNASMEQMQKQYDNIKNEKAQLQKIYDEIQMGNSELKKYNRDLEKQMNYLNEVLTEQNTELKKVNAFKDQKGLTLLINTYENRQINYRKDISRYEQTIKNLKNSCQSLESQLSEQRRQTYKLQDLNGSLKLQLNRYRQLNSNLLNKNETLIGNFLNKNNQGKQRYRQAQFLIHELSKQLQFVKNSKLQQQFINKNTVSYDNFEQLLQQKNQAQSQIHKLRQKIEQYENRLREVFQTQQNMKKAELKAQQLQQECNLLKSKLIVVQTKDFMERSGHIDFNQFEEKVFANIGQNQSFPVIKNTSDSSHFQLLKAYIVQLKEKLSKAISDKKEYQKKYRSLKQKIGEKIQKTLGLQQQNKLLKGKLQGFERLSQRLQYELEKNIQVHEEEINKMKAVTNSILTKKAEEIKMGNAVIKAQLEFELQKFQTIQKNLRQENETLKLQIVTSKLNSSDLSRKLKEANDFLGIYRSKFEQKNSLNEKAEQTNQILSDNVLQYEQLYREQRTKNEVMISQKQIFLQKIAQFTEQLQKKSISIDELNEKIITYQNELNRVMNELTQVKKLSQFYQNQLKTLKKQMQDKITTTRQSLQPEGQYFKKLQSNYQEELQKNKSLQFELKSLKLRIQRSNNQLQKVNSLQDNLNNKNNEVNDLKRKTINLQKKIGVLQAETSQAKSQYKELVKENNVLKSKLLENSQQIKKNYELKDIDHKRSNQKQNEQILSLSSELRQQKRSKIRIQSQLNNLKAQIDRLQQTLEHQKKKQMGILQQLHELKYNYDSLFQESQRNKSQMKYKNNLHEGLNNQINAIQEKVFKFSQQNTQLRLKYQSIETDFSDLRRQIGALKMYVNDLEEYSNSKVATGNWQEQRYIDNLSNFVFKFKKILRVNEVVQQNSYKENNLFLNNHHNGSIFGYKQDNENQFVMNSESSRYSAQRIKYTPQITSYGIQEFTYKNF